MAESTLSVTINSIRRELGTFLGYGRDPTTWSANQITDGDDIIARGLRMFYFPPSGPEDPRPFYEWSFLRTEGTITLLTNDYDYALPDGFSGTLIDRTIAWGAGAGRDYRPLQLVSEDTIRKYKAYDDTAGIPTYAAARTTTFNAQTGQRWELLVHPKPAAIVNNTTLTYRYITIPDTLTNTNIYPRGGAQHSETILAACLAAAEVKNDDDPVGPYRMAFQQLLQASMRLDDETKDAPGEIGVKQSGA